ncbi:acyl-CoA N-acyltransferase [Chytriomyces sp. MP71]|nr:acyl-CoA N-acyltransferase [Chytriomyces sp. MP71]
MSRTPMRTEFRRLESESDLLAASRLGSLSYTGYNLYGDRELDEMTRWVARNAALGDRELWGVFQSDEQRFPQPFYLTVPEQAGSLLETGSRPLSERGEAVAAVMPSPGLVAHWIHRSFIVNLFGLPVNLGGLAFVGVDMMHKRRGHATAIVTRFLSDCKAKGQYLAALYPFRFDFYHSMGFGHASPCFDYVVAPANLPTGPKDPALPSSYSCLRHLDSTHQADMVACQNRYAGKTHGMFFRDNATMHELVFAEKGGVRAVGYRDKESALRGYLVFEFEANTGSKGINDIKVLELVHETFAALFSLLRFLREQKDQARYIKLTTQDPTLYHLLASPYKADTEHLEGLGVHGGARAAAVQSVEMMVRIVDVVGMFRETLAYRDFNGVDVKVIVKVEDGFLKEGMRPVLLSFEAGRVSVEAREEHVESMFGSEVVAVLQISIADFSSLVVGAVSLKKLVGYGLASVMPEELLDTVHRAFFVEEPPRNSLFF